MSTLLSKPPIAITMGDAAGIGPEIIAKLYRDVPDEMHNTCVVGDLGTMRQATRLLGARTPVMELRDWVAAGQQNQIGVMGVLQADHLDDPVAHGQISADAGRLAASAIRCAAQAALRAEVSAVVTAPIHKEALALAGEPFPGHTELLQCEAALHLGKSIKDLPVRMMLANPELRVVLVSIHMSLRQALDAVTREQVLQTIAITHDTLRRTQAFALPRPLRIAVAGLNPHAGEGGLFGREELEVISPAVADAQAMGMTVQGPFAPDTVFMRARRGEFDVVVAMYHDQGLIPVKYMGVEQGVNVTLGLPFVRTSPDHGTAFDIAGQGVADASSLLEALRMARSLIS